MADNLTAGNPRAHAVRVYYFDTSTIYEGMPVCYDNSTTNWFGGSVADTGEVTAALITAEGSQNEGKYIRVEDPNADNVSLFAGVVKRGGWVGKDGPRVLDIYIPNGAVVPVRTDSNCLIDQTILAITTASQELGVPISTDTRPVAIARETVNRDTAGLVLAELCPERFLFQDMGGTPLSVDDANTTTGTQINHSNIKFLGSSIYNRALYMIGELAGGGAGLNGMFKFRTYVSSTMTSWVQVVCGNLHLKDDAVLNPGRSEYNSAFYATIETEETSSPAVLTSLYMCAYQAAYYLDESETQPTFAAVIGVAPGFAAGTYNWDGLILSAGGAMGDSEYAVANGSHAAFDGDAIIYQIPCLIGTDTVYLLAGTPSTVAD